MDEVTVFLPPYLQSLGYDAIPEMKELARRALVESDEAIWLDATWDPWRGIFEYVCCVEHARAMLKGLPNGRAIGSINVVPARYHSASLVFFAQATLDNIAVWSSQRFKLDVKGSDCAFHKSKFKLALKNKVPNVAASIVSHSPFIERLEVYRQEWIHRLTGGASIYSDKSPSEPDAQIQIMVPINPSLGHHSQESFAKAVARTRTKNGGRWLYPVGEFADIMADGLRDFIIAYVASTLCEP
jgi:hypothetical protein